MSFQANTVFLALLYIASCSGQESTTSQGENITFPLTYRGRILEGNGGQVCGSESLRQNLQAVIHDDIENLIRENLKTLVPCSGRNRGLIQLCPVASCRDVEQNQFVRLSGYYWIRSSNGTAVQLYCDMDRVCGCDSTRGWTRVAYLNTTDPTQQCPGAWREITEPRRTCGRSGGYSPAYFSTYGISYSQVCGQLVGYQVGDTDAFDTRPRSIDTYYVDGVSITHGSPRQHIWTFASAVGEMFSGLRTCPCTYTYNAHNVTVPSFVGRDYFCDTAIVHSGHLQGVFYADDPLWDGHGCGSTNTCCQFNNPPWFCKQLPQATTDDIEVRICGLGLYSDEDTPLELVEIYIR